MFLCLPEELYILSAFFVRHVHSEMILVFVKHSQDKISLFQLGTTQNWLSLELKVM